MSSTCKEIRMWSTLVQTGTGGCLHAAVAAETKNSNLKNKACSISNWNTEGETSKYSVVTQRAKTFRKDKK